VKIEPTSVGADDSGVFDVVILSKALLALAYSLKLLWENPRSGKTSCSYHLEKLLGITGQKVELCGMYRINNDELQHHGVVVTRQRMRDCGSAREGSVIWRRGDANGRPCKVNAIF
jgi:hypothetical protein